MVYHDDILLDGVDQIICTYVIHHGLSNNSTTEELRLMVAIVTRVKHAKYHPHSVSYPEEGPVDDFISQTYRMSIYPYILRSVKRGMKLEHNQLVKKKEKWIRPCIPQINVKRMKYCKVNEIMSNP